MDWVHDFYATTGRWWGPAESGVTARDRDRAALLTSVAGGERRVLELGCGYGATAVATAELGHDVTGLELTPRVDLGRERAASVAPGTATLVRGDFYTADVGGGFDVVCYWNGFGVGSDADQRRLLRRVADEWLVPDGVVLVDVANPLVWSGWDGEEEVREAAPDEGYQHSLRERVAFDPVANRAVDTWWETDPPGDPISQSIRCYTPADLVLLLEGTGLALTGMFVGGAEVDRRADHAGLRSLLTEHHEWLAVMRPD